MNEHDKGSAHHKGIQSEEDIIKLFGLIPSTKDDNIRKDIDAWEKTSDGSLKSISIKTQHTALRTGNLSFETTLINHENPEDTIPSWFLTGKAEEYWIVVGDSVYVLNAQKLKNFVHQNMWMFKTTKLTNKKLIEENINSGRKYCQSLSILVSLSGLEKSGLVEKEMFIV